MAQLELKDIRRIVLDIKAFYEKSVCGETKVLLNENQLEEVNGICEDLFMTNISNEAVVVHYGFCGDWTRAVLIPGDNFREEEEYDESEYSQADEAIEWFFS